MATQFDATARINVDLRGFAQAANEISRSGGTMTRIFQNLHQQLNQLEATNKKVSNDLFRLLNAFNQISNAAQKYAAAVQALNRTDTARGPERMAQAFEQLRAALANVSGMSAREAERIGRTVGLYNQLATALQRVARAYQIIRSVGQADTKQAQAAQRQAQAAQRLAIEQQRVEAATQRAANAQVRLNSELSSSSGMMSRFGQSSFAVRSSLGEIEQQGRLVLRVFQDIGTFLAGSAIGQEQAFAQVSRVVGEAAAESAGLLRAFQEIAATFPISFEEVARIGQLGAQIGIAANELEDFTKTVARFSLTTGVSVDQATLLLGRIREMQDVPIEEMENLGSAILALGTASAATDEEILRVNESIATIGNVFGLSQQAVTGLSAALATLRVRPELARGSLTRVFGEMDKAIQSGGDSLQKLSDVMGLTAKEVVNLRNENADEFFLSFVQGVNRAAEEAGGFQQVLRSLGINAVRDIDTFTRLANNYDVVAESFDRANIEWARGSELQRQSQGIFDTTAARLQNLSDEFKNFSAQAGGPFAAAIGVIAKSLSEVLKFFTELGPVVPILGTLTAAIVVGGGAWVAYQIILSKTIQSMLATRELQRTLGTSTLSLGTAMQVYRGELAAAAGASANMAGGLRLANSEMTVGQAAAARSAVALRAQGAAADQSALAMGRQVAASQAAVGSWSRMAAASSEAAVAMRGVAAATGQAAQASTALVSPTFVSAQALQRQAVAAGEAAAANRILASTSQQAAAAGLAGAAGLTAMGRGAQAMTLGARAMTFALGPWGIGLTTVALLMAPLISNMFNLSSAAERFAEKGIEAAGGLTALTNAIKADTAAFQDGEKAYRTFSVAQSDLNKENQELVKSTLAQAKEQKNSIELVKGSREELERQAKAHDQGAEATRLYLSQLDEAERTIERTTEAVRDNTIAIGSNTEQWLKAAAEAAIGASSIADGSANSQRALTRLGDAGVSVGNILETALRDPEKATKDLDSAIADMNKTIAAGQVPGVAGGKFGQQIIDASAAALTAKDVLEALKVQVNEISEESLKASAVQDLLGKALKGAGQEALVAGGKIKLTAENLEDLDSSAEDIEQKIQSIAQSLSGFGTPLDAFASAAKKAMGDSENAISKFSLASRSNLNLFLKELDKIAQAQQNWSANLVKISATLGTDIAQGLAKLGPEAAPMIQQLANLSAKELEKLKPRLAALGQESAESMAGGLLKGLATVQNISEKARTSISAGLSEALKDASSPEQFNNVVTSYDKMIKMLQGKKPKLDIDVAVAAADAEADIERMLKTLATADKLKIRPEIDVLFDQAKTAADFNRVASIVEALARAKKAKIDIDMDDAPARLTLRELQAWVLNQEVQGLLDAEGKAVMEDADFRKRVQALANLVLGKKAAGEFDANGDGKFNGDEFKKLFDALMKYIDKNRNKFDVTGVVDLTDNATPKLNGIMQAMAGFRANNTVTAYANVVQTTYRRQVDQGRRGSGSVMAASGGYISGPGGPTSDRIPAWLSDGEYVINAKATRRHRALLDKINASGSRAASTMPFHYASGGRVTAPMRSQNAMLSRAVEASFARAGNALVSRLDRMSDRRVQLPRERMGPVITVNNTYPREEPTSITINRALAYSAALNGTL